MAELFCIVVYTVSFLPLSSSRVWSTRFGFMSLALVTVLDYFLCVRLFSCIISACVLYHRLRGSASPVLTATHHSYGSLA